MFSPYYARSRARGRGDPREHCAINVGLYGTPRRWTMTERGAGDLRREPVSLAVGGSSMAWHGDSLVIDIDERGAPLPHAVRGTIVVQAMPYDVPALALDRAGRHRWHPVAPCARVTVELDRPHLRWEGPGYHDANAGDEPLEDGFASWHWSRARVGDETLISYDVQERTGEARSIALRCTPGHVPHEIELPPAVTLPRSGWGIARSARGEQARVVQTLLDAPFYARSLVEARVGAQTAVAMHESLDLDRFRTPWVRMMLPFRMPRIAWRGRGPSA
ncbi:MAG: carotenoid 1,2-hydratase [Burkholderiales bacterium]